MPARVNKVLFPQQAPAEDEEPAPATQLPEHLDQKQVQGTVEALGRELFQARSTADVRKVAHASTEVRHATPLECQAASSLVTTQRTCTPAQSAKRSSGPVMFLRAKPCSGGKTGVTVIQVSCSSALVMPVNTPAKRD